MTDTDTIRNEFPVFAEFAKRGQPFHYLDSAATSLKPARVVQAMEAYYRECPANVHRATYSIAQEATDRFEAARENIRRLINARSPGEIILTHGTTESINLVARAWAAACMKPGERILLTEMEHHSNLIPWRLIARERGFAISHVPVQPDGCLDIRALASLLGPDVKLCSFTLMSNVLGTRTPATELIHLAREHGARVCLDAAQAIAHFPVDVQNLACDFLAFSSHKMFGPTGTGVLYARDECQARMTPFLGGGDMIASVSLDHESWAEAPAKWEAGTPDIAGVIGLGEAVAFLESLDLSTINARETALTLRLEENLRRIHGVRILAEHQPHHGLISFVVDGVHPHDVAQFADQAGVAIRAGLLCAQPLVERLGHQAVCRASLSIHTNEDDLLALTDAVAEAVRFFT